ncbi:polysaccharide biosynthesis tyrosine autokinase [Cupriavidus sp. WKF15]|uniref:polysaccharide biosynthesis tyrosine autokinase n=1 Tax=Cupriavidus sp. WKF15 TaxID=3032282 RepID=UPI0023E29679|nr:polysaccharide biosynthesis tyrosine autokinase [Cupriavidus sp. WKF15]WER48962.1 polysaccharide biosynthesis tyrosine autokinase [Cupriavidus sp. WKF15]
MHAVSRIATPFRALRWRGQDAGAVAMCAALAATGALAAALYAWSLPSVYEADARVRLLGADTVPWRDSAGGAVTLEPRLLTSRSMLAPVVRAQRLDIEAAPLRMPWLASAWSLVARPGAAGLVPAPGVAPAGFAWGGEDIAVDRFDVPEAMLNQPFIVEVDGAGHFRLLGPDGAVLLHGRIGETVQTAGVSIHVGRLVARPGTRFTLVRRDAAGAVAELVRALTVVSERRDMAPGTAAASSSGSAGVAGDELRIAWRDADPRRASTVVNAVADAFIAALVRQRNEQASRTLAFVESELPRVRAELEQAERALARHRARAGSLAPSQEAQSYLSGSIEYQRQITALRMERARLLRRYTPENQEVRAIDDQIEQLRQDRRGLDGRLQNLSEAERDQVALARDVRVAEETYMTLRRQAQWLGLAESDAVSNVQLLDRAVPPMVPAGPPRAAITAGGAAIGLLLGLAVATVRRRLATGVSSAATVEAGLALPVVCEVLFSREQRSLDLRTGTPRHLPALVDAAAKRRTEPDGQADGGAQACGYDQFLLARQHPTALAVECLRTLRTALRLGLLAEGRRTVAVTSPGAGAGKTFGAVNLAVLAADAGMRVLLVDADLRRGAVARHFGVAGAPGLSDVLAGRASVADAVCPGGTPGLWLLVAGTPPSNPSELLTSPRLREMMTAGAGRFDLVLVDTPAVLSVSDAMLVCNVASATLLFLRAGQTSESDAAEALRQLGRAGAHVVGSILNGVSERAAGRVHCEEARRLMRASGAVQVAPQP